MTHFICRYGLIDLSDRLENFADTAAVMCNLDLVITCDSAPAHLAGALGVPVWVALSAMCDWRWLMEREDSPWYPTLRLFRQKRAGRLAGGLRKDDRGVGERLRKVSSE